MSDTISRKRFVDVSKLNDEQLQQLSDQLGTKVRNMIDEACNKANKILEVYGMQVKVQVLIQSKDESSN